MKTSHDRLSIPCGKARLDADLLMPERARGVVLLPFGLGGASQRLNSRDAYLAAALRAAGFATLLANLLTHGEDRLATLRYNIKLLTQRIVGLTHWLREEPRFLAMPVGYVCSGTVTAAAVRASDRLGVIVRAMVLRSGRPDLAGAVPLAGVASPTLLLLGERDDELLPPNRQAYERLACRRELILVPGAGPFFDEPGTMESAARHTARWISRWLPLAAEEQSPAAAPPKAADEARDDEAFVDPAADPSADLSADPAQA